MLEYTIQQVTIIVLKTAIYTNKNSGDLLSKYRANNIKLN